MEIWEYILIAVGSCVALFFGIFVALVIYEKYNNKREDVDLSDIPVISTTLNRAF